MIKPLHECIVAAFLRKSYFCLVLPKDKLLAVSTTDGCMVLNVEDMNKVNYCLQGESVNNVLMSRSGKLFASTLTNGVFMSVDGKKWEQKSKGLHVKKVWTIEEDRHTKGVLYAGTQYGHLFKSGDEGESWEEVTGLFNAPNRKNWGIDWGYGTTGLTIHTIKSDPFIKDRLFIVASGNGVYRSDDSGENWKQLKRGVASKCPVADEIGAPDTPKDYSMSAKEHLKKVHSCTHKIALSEKTNSLLFQQNHCGIYISKNAGESWKDVSPDKQTRHGFAIATAKNDMVFVIPAYQGICKDHLSCIKGMLRVLYSEDYGKTWKESKSGLPNDVHTCVLRDCLSVDRNDPANIFFGTTTGEVYYSSDEGESWQRIMKDAGRIQGIAALAA
jgi:photosystem II stability/assembly factor-like uncharacterized protein